LKLVGVGRCRRVEERVSEIEGADRWSYGSFESDPGDGRITVPLVRDDGTSTEFGVPDFVNDPLDLRRVALVVIGALEKWEQVQGLGG
jgi:hypothetical protein